MTKNTKPDGKNAEEAEREACISVIERNIIWSLLVWHVRSLSFIAVPIGGRRSSADGNNI